MKAVPLLFSLTVALALALGACGGGSGETPSEGAIPIRAPTTEVLEGDTLVLTADTKVTPLAWRSSDTRIASVSAQGAVLGCEEGRVTITVTGPDLARGSIDLRVVSDPGFNRSLPVEGTDFAPTLDRETSIPNCEVTLNLEGLGATIRRENYRPYHRLKLPQSGMLAELGKPELPIYALYFAIPVDAQTFEPASWSVTVVRESPRSYEGIRPWPHQPPRGTTDSPDFDGETPPFEVDETFYESASAWPKISYSARPIHVGNLPVLEVKVIPAQYTPATMTLTLFRTTRIGVSFQTPGELRMPRPLGDYKGIKERSGDAFITELAQNSGLLAPVDSDDLLDALPPPDTVTFQDLPFDLLILTRPSLRWPALRLAEWRQAEGLRVWLEILDPSVYPDAASILALIQDLDDRSRLDPRSGGFRPHAMRAICLFGDVEHIPTWEGRNQRNAKLPGPEPAGRRVPIVGTDLPYSTLRGLDWAPDVALGRISVEDRDEGDAVVDKIVQYESRPASDRPHSASVWGLFDDRPHKRALLDAESPWVTVTFTEGATRVEGSGTQWWGQIREDDVIRPWMEQRDVVGKWHARVRRVIDDETIELVKPWDPRPDPLAGEVEDPDDTITHTAGLQVGFQDGQDDWELVKGTERVRHFLERRGVDVKYGYTRDKEPATVPTPTHGFEGYPLHPTLLGDYEWNADVGEINTRWAKGVDGIVLYCGHGRPTGWESLSYDWWHLVPIDPNPGWYPIVLSMSCHSGFFDSETDRAWEWSDPDGEAVEVETTGSGYGTHAVSFCEKVLRKPDGGGIAAIGGSRGLDGDKNDVLIDGLFSAFYGDYYEGVILMGPGARHPYERLGDAVRAGKFTMHSWMLTPTEDGDAYGSNDALYPMQAIHLFGDPMLKIRLPDGPGAAR